MSHSFKIQKTPFIENILDPIAKLQDKFTLILKENTVRVLCESDTYKFRVEGPIEYSGDEMKLHFNDVKTFIRALKFIPNEELLFNYENDKISYKNSNGTKFVYHLTHELAVKKITFKDENILNFKYDIVFDLTPAVVSQIINAGTITQVDVKKIYFYTENKKVYAEVNDKKQNQVDSITFCVADKYSGDSLELSGITYDLVRYLKQNDMKVKACKNFFNFECNVDGYISNLIATCYKE